MFSKHFRTLLQQEATFAKSVFDRLRDQGLEVALLEVRQSKIESRTKALLLAGVQRYWGILNDQSSGTTGLQNELLG